MKWPRTIQALTDLAILPLSDGLYDGITEKWWIALLGISEAVKTVPAIFQLNTFFILKI